MGERPDPVDAAIARGQAAATVLNKHRDALFPHLLVLLEAFGPVHLRAIATGATEAVIAAHARRSLGDAAVVVDEVRG